VSVAGSRRRRAAASSSPPHGIRGRCRAALHEDERRASGQTHPVVATVPAVSHAESERPQHVGDAGVAEIGVVVPRAAERSP
jgi:hypothetical protein